MIVKATGLDTRSIELTANSAAPISSLDMPLDIVSLITDYTDTNQTDFYSKAIVTVLNKSVNENQVNAHARMMSMQSESLKKKAMKVAIGEAEFESNKECDRAEEIDHIPELNASIKTLKSSEELNNFLIKLAEICPRLQSLDLSKSLFIEPRTLQIILAKFPNLLVLGLRECNLTDLHFVDASFRRLAWLRTLDLSDNKHLTGTFIKELPQCLEELNMKGCRQITPENLRFLQHLLNLRTLLGFRSVEGSPFLPSTIRKLHIDASRQPEHISQHLQQLPQLKNLSFDYKANRFDTIPTTVETLRFSRCTIPDEAFDHLARLPHLKELHISENLGCSGDHFHRLRALKKLYLTGCSGIKDNVVLSIEQLPLEVLVLNNCFYITGEFFQYLPVTLKTLKIVGCRPEWTHLSQMSHLVHLRKLEITGARTRNLEERWETPPPNLTTLVLRASINSELSGVGQLKQLQRLHVNDMTVWKQGLEQIPSSVQELSLGKEASLYDLSLSALAPLAQNLRKVHFVAFSDFTGYELATVFPNVIDFSLVIDDTKTLVDGCLSYLGPSARIHIPSATKQEMQRLCRKLSLIERLCQTITHIFQHILKLLTVFVEAFSRPGVRLLENIAPQ
jgi:hypothetical protein